MSHKGQTLIRKLRQKIKVENEDSVKLEEVAEPTNEDFESKQHAKIYSQMIRRPSLFRMMHQ